jgi:ribosomal protein L21E
MSVQVPFPPRGYVSLWKAAASVKVGDTVTVQVADPTQPQPWPKRTGRVVGLTDDGATVAFEVQLGVGLATRRAVTDRHDIQCHVETVVPAVYLTVDPLDRPARP